MRRAASALLALALVVGLAGCTEDRSGEIADSGYIAKDFRLVEIPAAERGEPVVFAGETESGQTVSNADYAGEVLVVNFWFAACGPCRVEAPFLEEVWQEYRGDGAAVLGVNTYDQPETALAFAQAHDVTYPSVIAVKDGAVKLAFAAATPIQSTPTTLVLDKEGRVAARIIGQLRDSSVLSTIVRETIAESP